MGKPGNKNINEVVCSYRL